jgi:hypothetical protein
MSFLLQLVNSEDQVKALQIILKLKEAESIRGTNLWVLYSDLCGKNMDAVFRLCLLCPTDVLEDACSRQDYSGRELIKPYIVEHDAL